ncbi:O-antigen ligase domain-containing protein [Roseomonas sp. M0104]|uniref:O-antigen ligase domain-containing protein n=1 Tax=Teichococcus coralli TaxID=2545983 RepID=A0A845B747_9PROT|nr:O-antigen ligase family protein [Pseudoroseomonas coralli]MXP61926.1 O-antigen ligase domain-containing protein [Pseudoroseomonas coralli]
MTHRLPRAPLAWGAPTTPLAIAALLAPLAAVLQSRAMAPVALVALMATVLLARRRQGSWPWPRGAALWAGLALGAWGALSGLWALEPSRALTSGLSLAGLVLLTGAAVRAVGADHPGNRHRLGRALLAGLALGLVAAALDHATNSGLRAAVRGLRAIPPELAFGLKPAVSVLALLLPLLAGTLLPARLRVAFLVLGAAVVLWLPGDTAAIALLAGLAVLALASLEGWRHRPRILPAALGAAMAVTMLATPLVLPAVLAHLAPVVERLPPSAIHRLVIWDFGLDAAAQKPLRGWGMEAARALPGGREHPEPERLARLGVHRPDLQVWFSAPHLELMPLHPHNGPLQIRLELGWVGSLLAAAALWLLALSARGLAAAAAACGTIASAFVTFLASFGVWQSWWLCSMALAAAFAAGLLPPDRSDGRVDTTLAL